MGIGLLCLGSINTNADWADASVDANLLLGENMDDQKTVVHINENFYRFLLHSAIQGSPGLTSLS